MTKVKFLQWNIWYKEDVQNVLKVLKKVDADIICLQEATVHHSNFNKEVDVPKFLSSQLKMFFYYKPSESEVQNGKKSSFGNMILSKFKISNKTFKLIQKRNKKMVDDYSNENRTYLEISTKINNKKMSIGTTHMSYTDRFRETIAKNKEADKLVDFLKQKKRNFIFSGDLNALPDSYTINSISKILTDQTKTGFKTWTTKPFDYNGFKETKLKYKLDYIFTTKDVKVVKSKVVKTKYSDHLPILLEIIFE